MKIGFVSPWYGEKISGGAEAELRGVVKHLKARGAEVEVLTTCVESFPSDWNKNAQKPGLTEEGGIPVRRFRVRKRDTAAFDRVNARLIAGRSLTREEEEVFCREMINSPELYAYMKEHQGEYALFVFIPYMFGTTYYGSQICPEKSVLIPCLHDESYAYLHCFREAFSKVRGMIFNAEPERLLAKKLYGVEGEFFETFGIGMETDLSGDGERFRRKYSLPGPFMLYAGRKEAGKKVDVLIRHFMGWKAHHPGSDLKLVLIGGGEIGIPDKNSILDLGFVDLQDKYDAYAAADLFCNPSQMESFSLVIMEAWLAETPVLVNGDCPVTKDFVLQANAGLYYGNSREFEACVDYLLERRAISAQMGRNGREYVLSHFAWPVIEQKYLDYFGRLEKA